MLRSGHVPGQIHHKGGNEPSLHLRAAAAAESFPRRQSRHPAEMKAWAGLDRLLLELLGRPAEQLGGIRLLPSSQEGARLLVPYTMPTYAVPACNQLHHGSSWNAAVLVNM